MHPHELVNMNSSFPLTRLTARDLDAKKRVYGFKGLRELRFSRVVSNSTALQTTREIFSRMLVASNICASTSKVQHDFKRSNLLV